LGRSEAALIITRSELTGSVRTAKREGNRVSIETSGKIGADDAATLNPHLSLSEERSVRFLARRERFNASYVAMLFGVIRSLLLALRETSP
jgi:hypothetical protein